MVTRFSTRDMYDVVLEVGGTRFRTSMKTVKRIIDGKKFWEKIAKEFDLYGTIYIDRDPKVFGYILNYLRDGSVIVPRDGCTLAQIKQEAQFYGITNLVEKVDAILKDFNSDYLQI
ncbi:unnamed protein product [Cylicocyclus nassatus]|uniref:BTB domain-containing protein n=1 Tax=Cylicocyclus nassatus TaxID=53992 RepID=A0AA36DKU3_CYLNA|nr:unnamed protein product [Cylicocyclus nassatus]